jgi:tRNA1Val (adenine37-N6)-methyltransferase
MARSRRSTGVPGPAEDLRRKDETMETLLGERGVILQKRRGYRFSLDAVVLADFVACLRGGSKPGSRDRCLDLGTGSGIILVLLGKWSRTLSGYGVEIQESLADMADRNLRLHGLEDRFEILCMNLKDLPSRFPRASFDWITTNPPYRRLDTGRLNPDPDKALARHEVTASLRDICRVMAHLLRSKGRSFLVYPASRFAGLAVQLRSVGLEPKTVRPVYPKPNEKACWVLVEAVREGREELVIEPPLFVEEEAGGYTEEIKGIFRWDF